MKKHKAFLFISAVVLTFILAISVFALSSEQEIKVYLDGQRIYFDTAPIIQNDRTMIPLRAVAESMKAEVDWEESSRTGIIRKEATTIRVTIGDAVMYVNGTAIQIDSPAIIRDDRTLIPLRAIGEALDCEVGWDYTNQTVSIVDNEDSFVMLFAEQNRARAFHQNSVNAQLENGWYLDTELTDRSEMVTIELWDYGQCGDALFWELSADGVLRIFGTGAMYDYIKYTEPSPWYKYRNEPFISEDNYTILNPDGTTYLSAKDYFNDNPNGYKIKQIVIEEGVTYLGDWAFYRVCVDNLTIPEGVESTGYFCIRYSPTLKVVSLPDSLKILNDFGISRNLLLENINFGNGLEQIGRAGLQTNRSLKSVEFPDSLKTINEELHTPFQGKDYSNLGLLEGCSSLKTIDFGAVEYIPQRTCNGTDLESVIIPSSVKYIGEYAFLNNDKLVSVEFEAGTECERIERSAFQNCSSLKRVVGGTAIKSIATNTFVKANAIEEFDFSDSNSEFAEHLFYNSQLKTAKLGNGMSLIPVGIFSGSAIEEVYISGSVKEIQASAFSSCSNLLNIYYDGTTEEWNSIQRHKSWASGNTPRECVVHFNDGSTKLLKEVY